MTPARKAGLDPRVGIVLLLFSVALLFLHPVLPVELAFVGSIFFLMIRFGAVGAMLRMLACYLFLTSVQVFVIPHVSAVLAGVLSVFVYFKMLFPCGAAAALFVGTTSVRSLLEVFRRMRVPLSVSVSVAVSARYFPTLREDASAIRDAMRLRKIHGFEQKVECFYVPLLMSAVRTGEELAQSAAVRGIENPAPKTSLVDVRIEAGDIVALVWFGLLVAAAVGVK